MRKPFQLLLSLSLLCACAACGLTCTPPPNPSGSCTTPADGSHPGFSSAAACSWIRDCNLQLKREYFRVFVDLDHPSIAFMIPRPDGTSCLSADKREMPKINELTPVEALSAEHCLHDRLHFAATSIGFDVTPTALPDDIAEVCRQFPALAQGSLNFSCTRCTVRVLNDSLPGSCPSIAEVIPTLAEAQQLAASLNAIYGIKN